MELSAGSVSGGCWANVRFGSEADNLRTKTDVRFTAESGHWDSAAQCPLCAKSRPPDWLLLSCKTRRQSRHYMKMKSN